MQPLNLTQKETEILLAALKVWQKEPGSSHITFSIMGAVLCPKESRDEYTAETKIKADEAEREIKQREMQAILLMAKLVQYSSRLSEHDVIPA